MYVYSSYLEQRECWLGVEEDDEVGTGTRKGGRCLCCECREGALGGLGRCGGDDGAAHGVDGTPELGGEAGEAGAVEARGPCAGSHRRSGWGQVHPSRYTSVGELLLMGWRDGTCRPCRKAILILSSLIGVQATVSPPHSSRR